MARELERAQRGEVDYLAACLPSDEPVGIGGVDFTVEVGAGTLYQLAVNPTLQSRGIGTAMIAAAEARIVDRGLVRAVLAVEETNVRARSLYERLGYVTYGTGPDGWDVQDEHGTITRYTTTCVLMEHPL